jgi:membrane associated rhomboid family serine protease
MLEDRDYMRPAEYGRRMYNFSMTIVLIAINLVVFVWTEISTAYFPAACQVTYQYGELSNYGIAHGYLWQYLTFQFLHLGRMHFTFNMLGLFFLGRPVEQLIGSRKAMMLYLSSGIIGGIFQSFLGLIFPNVFGVSVVGASAGVCGLLAALGTLEPEADFLVFFLLPVKAKYLAWIGAVVAAFYVVVPAEPGIAHAAHLGGMAAAFAFVRLFIQGRWHLPQWPQQWRLPERRCPPAPRAMAIKRAGKKPFWSQNPIPKDEDITPDEYLQKEVDPILDKITAQGIQSLTPRERQILEKARSKMNKR